MFEEQMALRDQCRHPSGEVGELTLDELDAPLAARFAKMVALYPDRLAIVEGEHALTYSELDRASNRIAQHLLSGSDQADKPIAILLAPGWALLATTLAVAKAGKCHVGLPTETPVERLRFILEDMGCARLIADQHNLEMAQALRAEGLAVHFVEELLAEGSDAAVPAEVSPDSLLYVTYTSGSTGRPKGVMRTHRDFLHDVRTRIQTLQLCAQDRIAGFSYGNYAPAVISMLAGATYFEFHLRQRGMPAVVALMDEHAITVLNCKVTTFRQVVRSADGAQTFPSLRIVRLAGEPPTPGDILAARSIFPAHCVFSNQYGSTEAYIAATFYVDARTAERLKSFPAGYPNEGVEILLLDENSEVAPDGEEGEIAVQSHYLSPGYWNRPQLTEQAYRPGLDNDGRRIYLTGDLGRRDAAGCLHYLGRKDQQVKIRSHRVQIPEVEEVLRQVEGVNAVAVVARPGPDGNLRLIAYVVPGPGDLTVSKIRQTASQRLPLAMVPAVYVFLDELPLTNTSKVDRLALPDPSGERPRLAVAYAAPRTPVEEQLAQIWADVLGLARVGIHDSFLELGGDSLLASQVVTQVIAKMSIVLPVAQLFAAPTVADMALAVNDTLVGDASAELLEQLLAEVDALTS